MKKLFILLLLGFTFFLSSCGGLSNGTPPTIACEGLPVCGETASVDTVVGFITNAIALLIQYVGVVAVIAVMISGVMYILSSGEEEKTNKAKKWIIWSLVGVFTSVMAWFMIDLINNIIL